MSSIITLPLVKRGRLPDPLAGFGIRRLLAQRLRQESSHYRSSWPSATKGLA